MATIESLAAARELLIGMDALVGQSDHGATKSVYGIDPDGNEFEVMYMLPREEWGEYERSGVVMPLNMDEELARGRPWAWPDDAPRRAGRRAPAAARG